MEAVEVNGYTIEPGANLEGADLKGANLEVELVDGYTGELLAVRIIEIEGKTKGSDEESWQALRGHIERAFERFYVNYAARVEAARAEAG